MQWRIQGGVRWARTNPPFGRKGIELARELHIEVGVVTHTIEYRVDLFNVFPLSNA